MRLLANFSRIIVGIYLVFSGFVKVVDPYGTALKLEEYFEVFALDLPSFAGFFELMGTNAIALSVFMCCLELLLGVALLFRFRIKLTAWVMILFMLFMTFLTFYSAYYNKVTDCGCFGEFLKLEPWPTFWKNIVTLLPMALIFAYRKKITNSTLGTPAVLFGLIISLGIGIYSLRFLPVIDMLPYKTGNNISELMEVPDIKPVIEYEFLDNTTGESILSEEYLMDTTRYEYRDSKVVNEKDLLPVISDFSISDTTGNDVVSEILSGEKLVLIIKTVSDIEEVDFSQYSKLRSRASRLKIDSIIITSETQIEPYLEEKNLRLSYYYGDEKLLKTMARNNPVLYLLKEGTVLGKWSFNNLPSESKIKKLINK